MADTVNTMAEIEDLFQQQTILMLGYDTEEIDGVPQNQDKVRITYPQIGQPAFKVTDEVAFVSVFCKDDPYNRLFEATYEEIDEETAQRNINYTRAIDVKWTFYGPEAFDRADLVRALIFQTPYATEFKAKNIYLVPDVSAPVRLPEMFNGQWWNRADFSATFYEKVIRTSEAAFIKSAETTIMKG